jgi:hypothetical protein
MRYTNDDDQRRPASSLSRREPRRVTPALRGNCIRALSHGATTDGGPTLNWMDDLIARVSRFETLEQAFRWACSLEPRIVPLETIPQDEYSHDVVFRVDHETFLVFDAT